MKDKSRVPELLKVLEELDSYSIQIGIFGEDDSDILMIARVHEFGVKVTVTPKMRGYLHHIGIHLKPSTQHINIPERSFIRASFDEEQAKIISAGEKLIKQVIMLRTPVRTFFDVMGEYIVGLVRNYLVDLQSPSNHPVTVQRKGSSNPLIDTGRLRDSITHKVVKS